MGPLIAHKDKPMRIRGHIGDWPVDLTLELDPAEWAQLGGQLVAVAPAPAVAAAPVAAVRPDDALWQAAREVLRKAGQLNGPELLEHLEGLAGSMAAGKRLLVRLRHSAEVKVESGADAPVYHWVG
jgi:hypothetical protein